MFKSALIDKLNGAMANKASKRVAGGGETPFPVLPLQASNPFQANMPAAIAGRFAIPVGYNADLFNTTTVPSHIQLFTPALTNIF
jgi:hypothetical protein